MNSKELRAKRAKLIKDTQAILNKQKTTGADAAQVDRMLANSDALMVQIDRLEIVDRLSADMEGGDSPRKATSLAMAAWRSILNVRRGSSTCWRRSGSRTSRNPIRTT